MTMCDWQLEREFATFLHDFDLQQPPRQHKWSGLLEVHGAIRAVKDGGLKKIARGFAEIKGAMNWDWDVSATNSFDLDVVNASTYLKADGR